MIRDRAEARVTSADLTNAAIYDNMELGALIEAGPEPGRLHQHFQLLIDRGTLEPA
jgi:hypothetical protein